MGVVLDVCSKKPSVQPLNGKNDKRCSKTKVEVIASKKKGGEKAEKKVRVEKKVGQSTFRKDNLVISELKTRFKNRKNKQTRRGKEDQTNLTEEQTTRNEILYIFERFDRWDFDVLKLSELTNGYPLVYCAYTFLLKYDLFKKFSIDEGDFFVFIEKVLELHNNENQFNNCTRSSSVLQSFHFILRKGLSEFISEIDLLGAVIACIVMYVYHPGLDNSFQAKTEDKVSTLYNDMSILENVSCFKFVELIFKSDGEHTRFLQRVSKKQRRELREIVLDLVIASDLETHRSFVKQFKLKEENNSDFSSKEDIRILMQIAFKFCSIDYSIKPTSFYKDWVKRKLTQQFFQGDVERKLNYKVNSWGNRDTMVGQKLSKEQVDFLDTYVKPLVKPFVDVFNKLKFVGNQLRRNRDFFNVKFADNSEEFEIIYKDIPGTVDRLLKQQAVITKMYNSIKPPKVQDKNVPMAKQRKLMPKPTDEDKKLHEELVQALSKRWSASNKGSREPYGDVGKIYAVADFDDTPNPTYKERYESTMRLFDRIDEWSFDVFCLEKLLKDDCLFLVSWVLFEKYDFINHFKIPRDILKKFLKTIQAGYQRNPYHNALHACDVMQITNSICSKGGVAERIGKIDLMAAIISSMVHDFDHPGLNDAYQVHSFSYLAQIYNDRSVLEAHHVADTFRLIREEGLNIFQNLSKEQRRDCRKTMIDMIVSTDMCNHAKYVKAFNQLIEEESKFKKKKDIRIALQIVIKMADVSNPSRPTYLYLQWTECIIKEFFKQGDKEKKNNLPISPLMDREKSVISKGQMAFMEYVLLPMFKSFTSVFPKFDYTLELLEKNREYWTTHSKIEKKFQKPTKGQRVPVFKFCDVGEE